MLTMLKKIKNTIAKHNMLSPGDHIIIGLSGGADSVCLLHILHSLKDTLNLTLTAVHVNHALRGTFADDDERYSAALCHELNIPIKVYRYDITKLSVEQKISMEEAGRIKRYQAFSEVLAKSNAQKIAVAHNMNDNAETVLMNIFRGAGIKGMCGIPPVRDNIIRPLIEINRADIERYLNESNIAYVTDHTNLEEAYTRNKIRLQLIPLIQSGIAPNVIDAISRGSEIVREENDYLNLTAEEAYKRCLLTDSASETEQALDIPMLQNYPVVIARRVIRLCCAYFVPDLHDISYKQINEILYLIEKETGKSTCLSGGLSARRDYDRLVLFKSTPLEHNSFCYEIIPGSLIYIKEAGLYISAFTCNRKATFITSDYKCLCTKVFNYDRIINGLFLRTRQAGDKVNIHKVGNKKLKDYFIDTKTPRAKRDIVPLIAHGSDILWILDEKNVTNHSYRAIDGMKKITLQVWGADDEGKSKGTDFSG